MLREAILVAVARKVVQRQQVLFYYIWCMCVCVGGGGGGSLDIPSLLLLTSLVTQLTEPNEPPVTTWDLFCMLHEIIHKPGM